jgi:hypothetical protein
MLGSFANKHFWFFLLGLLAIAAWASWYQLAVPKSKQVIVIYLVPKDREYHQQYESAIRDCVKHLQKWYATQMDGQTFELSDPLVRVFKTDHDANWYTTHLPRNNPEPRHYTTYNALREASAQMGVWFDEKKFPVTHTDPDSVWLIYIDAPGGTGSGDEGFAVLPDHDLRGLVGHSNDQSPIRRWVGGSGHELGHGFGLHHPKDEAPTALMKKAYAVYPHCELTSEDKSALSASEFFDNEAPFKLRWNLKTQTVFLMACILTLVSILFLNRTLANRTLSQNSL